MTAHPGSEGAAGPREPVGGPGPSALPPPPPPPQGPPPPPPPYGHGYGSQYQPSPPPYQPGYGPQRRLVRRPDDKRLGGVASGIADYLGVDATLTRIGFILLAITGGVGIPLYVLLWLFLPEATPAEIAATPARPAATWPSLYRVGGWKAVAAIAVVILGAGILVGQFSRPEIFWALVLIGLGVYLFRLESRPPAALPGAAPDAGTATLPQGGPGAPPPPSPSPMPPMPTIPEPRPSPAKPKQRSTLGWVTIAAGLVVTGIAVVLSNLHWISLTPAGGLALFLMVLGIGLIVSAFRGRAGWLILVGILLLPVMAAASILNPEGGSEPWRGGVGTRLLQPASAAEVRPSYRLGGGQLVLDLRGVKFGSQPPPVRVSLGAGQLLVLVAPGQAISVTAHANAGQTDLLDHIEDGLRVKSGLTDPPGAADPLRLDLRVGAGEIEVRQLAKGADVPEIRDVTPQSTTPQR